MRTSDLAVTTLAVGLLSACGGEAGDGEGVEPAQLVECRLGGAADFASECALHWSGLAGQAARLLLVRHPDGGFRRLLVSEDGKRINVADGAEMPRVTMQGGVAEIAIGGDAYRIPASALASAR